MVHKQIHNNYKEDEPKLDNLIDDFGRADTIIGTGDRNVIKKVSYQNTELAIKSFKIPNLVNQIVYKFFRKSKAERSFIYAKKLMDLGIGTPPPVAYYEFSSFILFKKSFYISEYVEADITFRELTTNFDIPDWERILRAFTRFTYKLHENNVNFLDHSPGNTLIKKINNDYRFYLVDLNRMNFEQMDLETRIKNFSKLTTHKSMVKIMSDEYAKCSNQNFDRVFNLMWTSTQSFQEKFHAKRRLKNKLLFWRANK